MILLAVWLNFIIFVTEVLNRSEIHVVLIAGKARLAPMKQITIPRLELAAVVLSIQLDVLLHRELDIPVMESTFWTESEIVRAYIMNDERRFPVFEANRVSLIRQSSEANQWKHVNGTDNPADVASRGCAVNDLTQSWFRGPQFLSMFKSEWPSECQADPDIPDTGLEVNKVSVVPEPVTYALLLASEYIPSSCCVRITRASIGWRKQCVGFWEWRRSCASSVLISVLSLLQKCQVLRIWYWSPVAISAIFCPAESPGGAGGMSYTAEPVFCCNWRDYRQRYPARFA